MTYDEFKAELKEAKLSVKAFAELLEMNPNSITNYKRTGGVPRHLEIIAIMLTELAARDYGVGMIKDRLEK